MSEDPLSTYQFYVQIAEEDVEDGDASPWERVVATLAAEVRALRERMAFEKAKTDRFVAEALEITAEQDTELRALRARVAELEPDARLGRMVRKMPEGWEIYHSGAEDLSTKWSVHIWDAGEMDEYFGATPEEAIEKARQP